MWGRWRFPVQRGEAVPADNFQFEAIGRDGKPIRYVDAEGKPVDEKVGVDYWREISRPEHRWTGRPEINPASIGPSGFGTSSPSILWVGSSIDPKAISKLRVTHILHHTETLGPFPLDSV